MHSPSLALTPRPSPKPENAGPVSEAIFLHKPSKTLITTDAVVYVPDSPPPIFETYFDKATVGAEGFWPKSVLQAVFLPLRQGSEPGDVGAWPGYGAVQVGRRPTASPTRRPADPPICRPTEPTNPPPPP